MNSFFSDDSFVVIHYCYRSFIQVSVHDTISSLPTKDTQGRNLLFLTILENHEGKTVEMVRIYLRFGGFLNDLF